MPYLQSMLSLIRKRYNEETEKYATIDPKLIQQFPRN